MSYLLTQLDYGRFCVSASVAIEIRIEVGKVLTDFNYIEMSFKVGTKKGINTHANVQSKCLTLFCFPIEWHPRHL